MSRILLAIFVLSSTAYAGPGGLGVMFQLGEKSDGMFKASAPDQDSGWSSCVIEEVEGYCFYSENERLLSFVRSQTFDQ